MLDYQIYRNCFSSAEMRRIWSEHATITAWLKVEQVLARCQADLDLIPAEAAAAIELVGISDLDIEALAAEMDLVGRPIVGLVKQLRALVGTQGPHVHFNATTQDIMDTAMVMQMKLGLIEIETVTARLIKLLGDHTKAHSSTIIMGRTNGQHAVPMKLEVKLAVWRSELIRRREALEQAASRGLNVQIGGPIGDLRGYEGDAGEQVKTAVAARLGLGVVEPHWQNARDGIADVVTALGALCATLCKIAHNVNLLSSSDIAEITETHTNGKGASSSMHHKRNQRTSEFMEAVSRLGRQKAEQIGEFTLHEHERSGGAWIGEWVIVPEVFLLASGALQWSQNLFEDLTFHSEVMASRCGTSVKERAAG
ncbi:lyase family protein [Aliiroseovarius sp. 2305UL8-7]|uniref:lyase family protein n=1 Tax=Aliiroseovarius conchicola TaxID=3121637 RepID=UPI00352752B4